MLKKYLFVGVTLILLNLACSGFVYAQNSANDAKFVKKVREGITKLGSGLEAKVEVKLRDKTKLKGHIEEITDDSFVVKDSKTGARTVVPYEKVKQVKGSNSSQGTKIFIGLGILAAIAIIGALLAN